ncbi:mitochondrial coenzyme A transporter SLC25A42 [Trichonephila clavipes]|nr:mitochondrial coenzyme A transporter SLC25A42 [Trichonephila clavipes]
MSIALTLLQVTNKHYSLKEALQFIVHSYRSSGLLSLWRGNSATMARIIPYASIQFTAHEQWKRILHVETFEERKANPGKSFVAGSLAGIVSTTCTYPLDLARARMAVTHKEILTSDSRHTFMWREPGTYATCSPMHKKSAIMAAGTVTAVRSSSSKTGRVFLSKHTSNPALPFQLVDFREIRSLWISIQQKELTNLISTMLEFSSRKPQFDFHKTCS